MRGYWEQNAAGTALTLQGGKEEEIIIKKETEWGKYDGYRDENDVCEDKWKYMW